jgi:hypothetical protein
MGSSTECAAMLDVCLRRGLSTDDMHRKGKQLVDRIVAMLARGEGGVSTGGARSERRP